MIPFFETLMYDGKAFVAFIIFVVTPATIAVMCYLGERNKS